MKKNEKTNNEEHSELFKLYLETNGNMIAKRMNLDSLIDLHKELIAASTDKKDYGYEAIEKMLEGGENSMFLRSSYVSDYFKNALKEIVSKEDFTDYAIDAINSDKAISDMNAEELYAIYFGVSKYYSKPYDKNRKHNVSYFFKKLLFNIPSIGVKDLIMSDVAIRDSFARYLLTTNGINDRPSFYAGRGANGIDVTDKKLFGIFGDLDVFDDKWAQAFLEVVRDMETLGATEFINTFLYFALLSFSSTWSTVLSLDNNYSLDGVGGSDTAHYYFAEAISTIALAEEKSGRNSLDSQKITTAIIKNNFFRSVLDYIQIVGANIEFDYQFDEKLSKIK